MASRPLTAVSHSKCPSVLIKDFIAYKLKASSSTIRIEMAGFARSVSMKVLVLVNVYYCIIAPRSGFFVVSELKFEISDGL